MGVNVHFGPRRTNRPHLIQTEILFSRDIILYSEKMEKSGQ